MVQLKVQCDLCSHGARSYIVRAAEGGEEVIQSVLVRDVYGCKVEVDLVVLPMEDVVFADGGVEQVARSDAGRIMVVILPARCGNRHQVRLVSRIVARGEAGE